MIEHDRLREDKTVAFSAATPAQANNFVRSLGLFHIKGLIKLPRSTPLFSPFDWGGRSEPAGSPDATNHLRTELQKFGVSIGTDGYCLNDTHKNCTILRFSDEKIGKFSGGIDAIIAPFLTAEDSCAQQLCVAFEYKLEDLENYKPQAILLVIAARCLSE